MEAPQAHRLHRARNAADVSRVLGLDQHDPDPSEAHVRCGPFEGEALGFA
jgi:hypothetical protein